MTATIAIHATGRTHVGHIRKRNEDSHYVGTHLFAVADGLSGHVSGDVASSTVIEAISPYDRPTPPDNLLDTMGRLVYDANRAIQRRVATTTGLAGMGTTLVAVLVSAGHAAVANVGDSRVYLRRATGKLVQLTEDHVYAHLVADSAVVPNLPERLSRFLDGRADGRSPDITPLELKVGDRVLLCSDGLSNFATHTQIEMALARHTIEEAVSGLEQTALDGGGGDNVTAVVVEARDANEHR